MGAKIHPRMSAKAAFLIALGLASASAAPVEDLVNAFTRTIQSRDSPAFEGILADDFRGYVGGWGPTTCVNYDKAGFVAHVKAWQSTWSTNYTSFEVRHKVQSGNTMALVLTIAYWSKPGMPGGPVNADEVLQFFWLNDAGTQITGFLEASGLVPSDNAKAMLDASWNPYVAAINTKNASTFGNTLADDARITEYLASSHRGMIRKEWKKQELLAWMTATFKTRENAKAVFPIQSNAACKNYVWGYSTQYDLQSTGSPEKNTITLVISYMQLNNDGSQVDEVGFWVKDNGVFA